MNQPDCGIVFENVGGTATRSRRQSTIAQVYQHDVPNVSLYEMVGSPTIVASMSKSTSIESYYSH